MADQVVRKNLMITKAAETSVVMSLTRNRSLPPEYRGVEVPMALYPFTPNLSAMDSAMQPTACAPKRVQALSARVTRDLFFEGTFAVCLFSLDCINAADASSIAMSFQ